MINQQAKVLLIFGVLFFTYSCSKDVELGFNIENPRIVLNCLLSPDKPISARLSSSTSILDSSYQDIKNAHVTLFENGEIISELKFSTKEGMYVSDYYPKAGSIYTITASADGFNSISAVDSLPLNAPEINGIAFHYPSIVMEDMTLGKLIINIKDPDLSPINYYEIILTTEIEFSGKVITNYVNFYAANEVVNVKDWDPPYPRTILFTNRSFSGKSIEFNVFVNNENCPIVKIRRISSNYYKYKTALYIHKYTQAWTRETMDDFFKGEPTEMYSNIRNGYGIFASYAEYKYNPDN